MTANAPVCITRSLRLDLLLLGLVLAASPAYSHDSLAENELVMLNWAEYLDPKVIEMFHDRYDATIREVYYESDSMRDSMLAESGGHDYDIAIVNGSQLFVYRKMGWLAPIDARDVPNVRHIAYRWQDAHPDAAGFAVPYFWGTIGIAYRRDLVTPPIESWEQLFRPAPALCGRIMMSRDAKDLVGMALKAAGYSLNSTEPAALAAARDLLLEQEPCVRDYAYMNLTESGELVTGEIHAALMYSGDAVMLADFNEDIAFVTPKEGTNLWIDYLVVLASSTRKALAYKLIDFLNEPAIAARQALYVRYPTPNRAAAALLPAEFKSNRLIYPPDDILEHSEFDSRPPVGIQRARNRIFDLVVNRGKRDYAAAE